jgi:hypothetical protein
MIKKRTYEVSNSEKQISITIPADKNPLIIIFLVVLIFWFYAGFNDKILQLFFGSLDAFDKGITHIFWITGGVIFGIQELVYFFWGYFGKERIIVADGKCFLSKTVFNIGIHFNLEISRIKNIRVEMKETGPFSGLGFRLWGMGPGKIKLDYGPRTFSFGIGIEINEAYNFLELLKEKIK